MSCELCRNYDFRKIKVTKILGQTSISLIGNLNRVNSAENCQDFQYCPLCGRKLKVVEPVTERVQYTGEAEQKLKDTVDGTVYIPNVIYEFDAYKWYVDSQGYLHKIYVTDTYKIQYDKLMPDGTWYDEQTLIYQTKGEAMYYYNSLK